MKFCDSCNGLSSKEELKNAEKIEEHPITKAPTRWDRLEVFPVKIDDYRPVHLCQVCKHMLNKWLGLPVTVEENNAYWGH